MSRNVYFLYTGLTLLLLCLTGCGTPAVSKSEAEPETSLDEQLIQALSDDDVDAMASVLEAGADPDATSGSGRPVLLQAAIQGKVEAAQLLIDHGANINAETTDGAILVKAAGRGHEEIVEMLLEAGADANATGKEGANELTSIFAATLANDPAVVTLLIEHGVDINQGVVAGNTPLCIATGWQPNAETVKLLLENGADINHQNDLGETALHQAARKGLVSNDYDTEIIRLLIKHGATLDIEDNKGQTALDIVGPDSEIGQMLLEADAEG